MLGIPTCRDSTSHLGSMVDSPVEHRLWRRFRTGSLCRLKGFLSQKSETEDGSKTKLRAHHFQQVYGRLSHLPGTSDIRLRASAPPRQVGRPQWLEDPRTSPDPRDLFDRIKRIAKRKIKEDPPLHHLKLDGEFLLRQSTVNQAGTEIDKGEGIPGATWSERNDIPVFRILLHERGHLVSQGLENSMVAGASEPVFCIVEVTLASVYNPVPETAGVGIHTLADSMRGIEIIKKEMDRGETAFGHCSIGDLKTIKRAIEVKICETLQRVPFSSA